MTDDTPTNGVASAAEFEREITRLLIAALDNGVDVRGGWEVQTDGADRPDWDVVVTALRRAND